MILLIKTGYRELRNHFRFVFFFTINLSLGLVGFILLNSFGESIKEGLRDNLRNILTADISIFSRSAFTAEERQLLRELPPDSRISEQTSLFSMTNSAQHSLLSRIIGIDENFPLYGTFRVTGDPQTFDEHLEQLLREPVVWMYAETRETLGVKTGENVRIGEQNYRIGPDILDDPPGNGFGGFAPKIYMGQKQLDKARLIQPGSRAQYRIFIRLSDPQLAEIIAGNITAAKEAAKLPNKALKIISFQESGESVGAVVDYVLGFLGLVAIVALFLAGTGASYLFRSYIALRMIDVAIFRSLGASSRQAVFVPVLQLICLGILSALISTAAVAGILPLLELLLEDLAPRGLSFEIGIHVESIYIALVIASLGSLFFCLPSIVSALNVAPAALFRESIRADEKKIGWGHFISYLPAVLFLWGLAIWQTGFKFGTLFTGCFLAALTIIGLIGWVILRLCAMISSKHPFLKIALRNLGRNRIPAISCFLAIGFGSFLLNTIPQVFNGIDRELQTPKGQSTPSLFLFDIQPEQVRPLTELIAENGFRFSDVSPMISAFLVKVNGEKPELVLEDGPNSADGRNMSVRRFNLSYRDRLSASEKIIQGVPFSGVYDQSLGQPAEISMEERFADRNNLRIGDQLEFDIFGTKVHGKIINLRKVKWNSFRPNFFVLFQPGTLDEFPQTSIGTVSALSADEKTKIRRSVLERFSNISVIDVARIVERIIDIARKMSWAITAMAYISVFTGLVVVFSIARGESLRRIWEINLLKTLGARFGDLRLILLTEYGLLIVVSAVVGIALSWIVSAVIALEILDSVWSIYWQAGVAGFLAIAGIGLAVILLATNDTLKQQPWKILRSS